MNHKESIEKQICTLKGIHEMLGMNRTEFLRYMDIPLRTLEEWEAGRRKMPEYVLRLITYYVKVQQVLKKKGIELECDPTTVAKFATVKKKANVK